MNDLTNDTTTQQPSASPETLVDDVIQLGTTWVRYGLTVGEAALRTSAQSLEGAAKVLTKLSETLAAKH